jgi:hypothetical protein
VSRWSAQLDDRVDALSEAMETKRSPAAGPGTGAIDERRRNPAVLVGDVLAVPPRRSGRSRLANSLSRKTRGERQVAVINKRFEVYPELWKATAGAAPMDEVIGGPALNQDQRDLYEAMAEWFWEGAGAWSSVSQVGRSICRQRRT